MKPRPRSLVEVLYRPSMCAAAALQAHLHVDLAALGDRADVNVLAPRISDIAISLDGTGGHNASLIRAEVKRLGAVAVQLERNLLQVQNDVGRVFNNAGDRLKLMQNTLGMRTAVTRRCAFNGRQQGTAERVTDGRTSKPRSKRWLLARKICRTCR